MAKKLISVIIPSYNEEKNIPLAYEEVIRYIDDSRYDYEIIFVNDGSRDGTWDVISDLTTKNGHVKGINFSRNFGHAAALQAGMEQAKGDAVIMLDADMQHPPSYIPKLVAEWEAGYDIVNTIRLSTEKISFFKRFTAKAFYALINAVSELKINDGEADFRLIDRKVLDVINSMPESPKFYRGLVNWVGFRVQRISYRAVARRNGASSFTINKMFEFARLGLTSFSMKPLKLIISVGLTLSLLSVLGLLVMLGVKFLINPLLISYGSLLIVVLIFMTGVLTTFQGVIAIYLVDIFNASKGRPTFIIKEQVGYGEK